MTEQEIKERSELEAWDGYQEELCELEFNLREAAFKWFDKYCGERFHEQPLSYRLKASEVFGGLRLSYEDYQRWKHPRTSSDLPF